MTAAPTAPDSGECDRLERLARLVSRLLLHGMSSNLLASLRTLVLLLRAPLPQASLIDGGIIAWRRALLGGGSRAAIFASATLQHARRLLLALDASTQRALAASVVLRERAPSLVVALQLAASRAEARRAGSLSTAAPSRQPRDAAPLAIDDSNRHRFRERSAQTVYNNRERQRDEFFALQRAWLDAHDAVGGLRGRGSRAGGRSGDDSVDKDDKNNNNDNDDDDDDVARLRSALQALVTGARAFLARLDALNVPWLCSLLVCDLHLLLLYSYLLCSLTGFRFIFYICSVNSCCMQRQPIPPMKVIQH